MICDNNSKFRLRLTQIKLTNGGTVENFRRLRRFMTLASRPVMSRIDLMRTIRNRPRRKPPRDRVWSIKKAMKLVKKNGWGRHD